jgi:hypothetical protein
LLGELTQGVGADLRSEPLEGVGEAFGGDQIGFGEGGGEMRGKSRWPATKRASSAR